MLTLTHMTQMRSWHEEGFTCRLRALRETPTGG